MPATENEPAMEITVVGPAYWADHVVELAQCLGAIARGPKRMIADPSARSAGQLAVIVDPAYWSAQSRELADSMRRAAGELAGTPARRDRDDRFSSGAADAQDKGLRSPSRRRQEHLGSVAHWHTKRYSTVTFQAFGSGAASSFPGRVS